MDRISTLIESLEDYRSRSKARIELSRMDPEEVCPRLMIYLQKDYPNINIDKFNSALRGITCMMINDEIVIYHCDIDKALCCGIENRNLSSWEWD